MDVSFKFFANLFLLQQKNVDRNIQLEPEIIQLYSDYESIFNNEPSFVSDVFVKLDTQERIVNQSISHAHHRHAKMEARADKPDTIHTTVNAHQVKKDA